MNSSNSIARTLCSLISVIGCLLVFAGYESELIAQCTSDPSPLPNGVIENVASCDIEDTRDAGVGFDEDGRFAIVWVARRGPVPGGGTHIYVRRFLADGEATTAAVSLTNQFETAISDLHIHPSIDVSAGGLMPVARVCPCKRATRWAS